MKLTLIAVASTVFVLSLSARAEDMPGMQMDGMEGMEMKQESKQAPVASAEGTIKSMDTAKHTVTLAHGAVPAVQWPPMTMAFSVEGRAPFAAPAVQKFAGRLPWQQLIRDDQLKWVLRQAFAADLPQEIVARPKHGFNVPIDHWLQGEWNDLLQDTFSETAPLRRAGILSSRSRDYAMTLLNDPRKVPGHVLFTFVMLHLWMCSVEN